MDFLATVFRDREKATSLNMSAQSVSKGSEKDGDKYIAREETVEMQVD
jgi:hypothetical protein